jgi:large subunit ribosomal protein L18
MKRDRKINFQRNLRKARAGAKLTGDTQRPRVSVFRSNKFLYVQLIDDGGGRTIISSVGKKGVVEAAKLGEKVAQLAKKAGIKSVVLDRGRYKYQGQIKALTESLRQGGLKV